MKLFMQKLIAKHPDNTNGLIAFFSTFAFIAFVAAIICLYLSFYNKAIKLIDKDELKASISFNALNKNNPRFGYFQLGAIATDEQFEEFEDNYLDYENDTVDIEHGSHEHRIYNSTVALSSERHRIYKDIDAVFHVQFKNNQLIYIKYIFLHEDTDTCKASFEQLSTRFSTVYGLNGYYDDLPEVKLHATYRNNYAESNVIDDKFAVSIEHDCGHSKTKDINVRMGYLPSIINKRELDALQDFNTSF